MLRDASMFTSQVHFSSLPPEPVIPSKKPFKVELLGGKRYSWCTCGHSKKQVELPLTSSCIKTLWPHILFTVTIVSSCFPAVLRRSSQTQSPRPAPAPLRPRQRHHSLVVWLQAHEQPSILWWHAQTGLHRVCSPARTQYLLKRKLGAL